MESSHHLQNHELQNQDLQNDLFIEKKKQYIEHIKDTISFLQKDTSLNNFEKRSLIRIWELDLVYCEENLQIYINKLKK